MILVSVGTHYQPFERLVKAADDYAATTKEQVIIQKGITDYSCSSAESFDFCSKEEMSELINKADVLVFQGGWGALCEAIDLRKRIVAVPRIEGVEHIHNQEQIVRKLEELGCVLAVYDINKLGVVIEQARSFHFHSLERGDASIIKRTIVNWFPSNK